MSRARKQAVPVIAAIFICGAAVAQPPAASLRFEVASIKPADPNSRGVSSSTDAGEGLDVRNISVRNLITLAYSLRDFQLKGGPGWIDSESYDVLAKASGGEAAGPVDQKTRFDRVRERLRSLLADRFGLVVHHESREEPAYMLTVAKSGPKLALVSAPAGPPHKQEGRGHSQGFGVPMEMLVVTLSNATNQPVIDKTGLVGRYDYTLNWDPASTSLIANPDAPPSDGSRPSLFTAVQEQLGLRLESGKAPADVVVIDRVDHPSGN